MVGFSRYLADADVLLEWKSRVIEDTKRLFREDKLKLFTGGGRTKANIAFIYVIIDDFSTNATLAFSAAATPTAITPLESPLISTKSYSIAMEDHLFRGKCDRFPYSYLN